MLRAEDVDWAGAAAASRKRQRQRLLHQSEQQQQQQQQQRDVVVDDADGDEDAAAPARGAAAAAAAAAATNTNAPKREEDEPWPLSSSSSASVRSALSLATTPPDKRRVAEALVSRVLAEFADKTYAVAPRDVVAGVQLVVEALQPKEALRSVVRVLVLRDKGELAAAVGVANEAVKEEMEAFALGELLEAQGNAFSEDQLLFWQRAVLVSASRVCDDAALGRLVSALELVPAASKRLPGFAFALVKWAPPSALRRHAPALRATLERFAAEQPSSASKVMVAQALKELARSSSSVHSKDPA